MLKDFCVSLALIVVISLAGQASFAAWEGAQALNPMTYISYLNPLPYLGIGENKTNFSLNPFTGFKNCNKCKVQRVCINSCDREPIRCNSCHKMYVQPRCSSCGR